MQKLKITKFMNHVSQRTGVDVSVVDAAVFSVSIFPVGWTVVVFTKPPSLFRGHDGTKHTNTVQTNKGLSLI